MSNGGVPANSLTGSVAGAERTERGLRLRIRLRNNASRALHYISDVRGIKYDPAARRLNVRLTDEGRVVFPGAASKLPVFRFIDPAAEAEIAIDLPDHIVKLAATPSPSDPVAFETQQIDEAQRIVIDIAWSDVPFYADTRAQAADDKRFPAERWQKHKLSIDERIDL